MAASRVMGTGRCYGFPSSRPRPRRYPKVRQARSKNIPLYTRRQKREKIGRSSFVIVVRGNDIATTEETGLWPVCCQELRH